MHPGTIGCTLLQGKKVLMEKSFSRNVKKQILIYYLYFRCFRYKTNPNILFISETSEIIDPLPAGVNSVGVCGATSTPKWLMEEVAKRILEINEK